MRDLTRPTAHLGYAKLAGIGVTAQTPYFLASVPAVSCGNVLHLLVKPPCRANAIAAGCASDFTGLGCSRTSQAGDEDETVHARVSLKSVLLPSLDGSATIWGTEQKESVMRPSL